MGDVTQQLHDHYRSTFLTHGATSSGVDWGPKEDAARLRQDKMLALADESLSGATLLDVGCGYGALAERIGQRKMDLGYTGIDIVGEMVEAGRKRNPTSRFIHGDFLSYSPEILGTFDYVVCNGILTQKLQATTLEMNAHAHELISAMFATCRRGCAFNVMTSYVNYQVSNLYYRNPAELLAWCMSQLTPKVRLDHAYPLYEYTVYLYRDSFLSGLRDSNA